MQDEDNCRVGGGEDVAESVPMLKEEEEEDMVDLLVVVDETGRLILKTCG